MSITRSPSEFFIKFLISQQEHEPNAILRLMEDFGLDGISASYIRRLEKSMSPMPDPWDPASPGDTQTRRYLKEHGILNLWYPTAGVQEAYTILSNANLRADVQQLLLSPLRVEDIAKRLNEHRGVKLTADGVQAYGHYFWKKDLLSMHDWVDYLDGKPQAYESITAMRASPDMAQSLVPWVTGLGGTPKNVTTGQVARRVRDVAFMKMLEIERMPSTLAHSKMMKNYMDVIRGAENEMRQSDVALNDVLKTFEKFRLTKDESKLPSIEDVAGPNYSQSGVGTDANSSYDEETLEDKQDG